MTNRHLTPQSFNRRVNDWDGDGAVYDTFPQRTADELAARFISDNERTAMHLLKLAKPHHPALAEWVGKLADATYAENAPKLAYDESCTSRDRAEDRAILVLGLSLVDHRMEGEEGHRDGFPLAAGAVAPLTEAICRYYHDMLNVYATELYWCRLGTRPAAPHADEEE